MDKDLGSLKTTELVQDTSKGDFWTLNFPGTNKYVMIQSAGELVILTFPSEEIALKFKAEHSVPAGVVPKYIPENVH